MFHCELCGYSTKLRGDWNKHLNTKNHINITRIVSDMTNVIEQKDKEIADLKKTQKYDSIEDVRTAFFLNSMFMNQTKKDYELQDFGRWIVMNRMVCKSFQLE